LEICGGEASEVVRAGAAPATPKVVAYDPALVAKLGGVEIAPAEQKRILPRWALRGADWRRDRAGWRPDVDGAPGYC
jgi:phenylalanyl-tRNA synthetase beta chain